MSDFGMNDFLKKGFEFQQDMARQWMNAMSGGKTGDDATEAWKQPFGNPFKMYEAMYEAWQKQFKSGPWALFEPWTQSFAAPYADARTDLFAKVMNGGKVLEDIAAFWQQLFGKGVFESREELLRFVDQQRETCTRLAQDFMLPFIPEQIRPLFMESQDLLKQYEAIGKDLAKPWLALSDQNSEVFQDMLKGKGTGADFYKAVTRAYESSYGKIFNAAGLGLSREQNEVLMSQFDSFFKMMIAMTELLSLVSEVSKENMIKVVEAWQDLIKEGKSPQTMQEFYKLWLKINEDSFVRVFGTPQFSQIFCEFAQRACQFKIHFDKVMEQALSWAPIPRNSDMASLYKTVYNLRKSDYGNTQELQSLRDEVAALKRTVDELSKASGKGGK